MNTEPEELTLYRELAQVLAETLELDQLAAKTAALVVDAVGASVCFVHLVDPELMRLELVGATPPFDSYRHQVWLGLGDGIAGWVAQTGQVAVVPDKWTDHRYRYLPELQGELFRILISVPMIHASGNVVGVLNVHWQHENVDLLHQQQVLTTVASFLAGAFEHTLLVAKLGAHERALEGFAQQLIEAQEAERRRLQLELHDGVLQQVHAAYYRLEAVKASPGLDEHEARDVCVASDLLKASTQAMRRLIQDTPRQALDEFGFAEAIETLANSYPDFAVVIEDRTDDTALTLGPERALAVLRIMQEAINNAWKHSGVTTCELRLASISGDLVVVVRDRGDGFDTTTHVSGFGLGGMRERARIIGGRLELFSTLGEGTLVRLLVPIATNAVQ
ncbi:MAG: GAF domain-containing protein [Ferrimicrobium sp.]